MKNVTKSSATALAALLASAPVGAFARIGISSNAEPTAPNPPTNQIAPRATTRGNQQLRHNTVVQVQRQLKKDGLYQNGRVDGIMGQKAHTAVMDFQRSKGLTANGQLDSQTLAKLGVSQRPGSGNKPRNG